MLLGEHEHALDEKNRLTLPSKLRGAFDEGVVVTRGLDGCLFAWPMAGGGRWPTGSRRVDPLSADGLGACAATSSPARATASSTSRAGW